METFKEPVIEVASDDTFKYLLLTVSGLLIIVSCLMLAKTWVTRKHMNQGLDDREALRQIRVQQHVTRNRQNVQMQPEQVEDYSESGSEGEEDESESVAGGVNDQLYRVQALNQLYASRSGSTNRMTSSINRSSSTNASSNQARSNQEPVIHGGVYNLEAPGAARSSQ